MSKIAGICERIKKWWQSYNLWVFVALIFMFIIVGWIAEHQSGAYRSLGIAATLLSIVLSIIVIVYTMAQTVKAEINQHEMRNLMQRTEDAVQGLGKDVSQIKDNVLNNPAAKVGPPKEEADTTDKISDVGKEEVFFNLSSTSDIARLFAYFLLRSNKLGKALSIDLITAIIRPLLKMPPSEVATYVLGILQGMMCSPKQHLEIVDQKNVRLKELPERFEEHMNAVVSWMKDRNPDIEGRINEIDAIQ